MPFLNSALPLKDSTPKRVSNPSYGLSSSKSVLNRKEIIEKNRQKNISLGPGDYISTLLVNDTSFLDLENSYFRGTLTIDASDVNSDVVLEENGLHALFSKWTATLESTGQVLNEQKHYNMVTPLLQKLAYDKDGLQQTHQYDLRGYGFDKGVFSDEENVGAYKDFPIDGYSIHGGNVIRMGSSDELKTFEDGGNVTGTVGTIEYKEALDRTEFVILENVLVEGTIDVGDVVVVMGYQDGTLVQTLSIFPIIAKDFDGVTQTLTLAVSGNYVDVLTGAIIIGLEPVIADADLNVDTQYFKPWQQVSVVGLGPLGYLKSIDRKFFIMQENLESIDDINNLDNSTIRAKVYGPSGYTNERYIEKGTTQTIPFLFRPELGLMKYNQLFPMFLLGKGIRLEGQLDPNLAKHSFVWRTPKAVVPNGELSVALTDIEFVSVYYQMSPLIVQQYLTLYETSGIFLPMVEYAVREEALLATKSTQQVELKAQYRSVHHVLSRVLPHNVLKSSSTVAYTCNTLSMYPLLQVDQYYYKYAGLQMPSCPIDLGEDHLQENMIRLKALYRMYEAVDSIYTRLQKKGLGACALDTYKETQYLLNDDTLTTEYTNVIHNIILARDECGVFAGLDLQLDDLMMFIRFSENLLAGWGETSRILQAFIAHDTILHISQRATRRLV